MWENIGLSKSTNKYPLHLQGLPFYKKNANIPSTYTLSEEFQGKEGKEKSLSLFDGRNKWLKQGLKSKIFPVWSVEKFYHFFGNSLYNVLLKYYHLKKSTQKTIKLASPEDYWIDVQIYFLQKTEREQIKYAELVKAFGSFCHYPIEKTYKTGGEILKGILWLYNEKIKDIFKNETTFEDLPLEDLTQPHKQVENSLRDLSLIGEGIFQTLFDELRLNPSQKMGILTFFSLNSSREKKLKIVATEYGLEKKFIRKIEHILYSDYLPEVLNNASPSLLSSLEISTGPAKKSIETWLRTVANRVLAKNESV